MPLGSEIKVHIPGPHFPPGVSLSPQTFFSPSLSIPKAFLCVIYFPEKAFQWAESLRTLKFRWMIMSIVKEAVKLSPWFWLLSREPQELIVWMVMRPGRQQMLARAFTIQIPPTNSSHRNFEGHLGTLEMKRDPAIATCHLLDLLLKKKKKSPLQ